MRAAEKIEDKEYINLDTSEKLAMEKELKEALWYCDKLALEIGLDLRYKIKGISVCRQKPLKDKTIL